MLSDPAAAAAITKHLDQMVVLCQADPTLQLAALKFQMEHASAKADFDRSGGDSAAEPPRSPSAPVETLSREDREKAHLRAALMRMMEFGLACGRETLERATDVSAASSQRSPLADRGPRGFGGAAEPPTGGERARSGSVDDLATQDALMERAATISHLAVQVLGLVFLVSEELRPVLQRHALHDLRLLDYVKRALLLDRETELSTFAEGFKTGHMNLLANFCYKNTEVCSAVGKIDPLLVAVLAGTRVDEENPGMVEWAEFTVRCICEHSGEARDFIRGLTRRGGSAELHTPAVAPK